MPTRVYVPAGHNDTTEVFKRTASSTGFLCCSVEAVAMTAHKTSFVDRAVWSVMRWGGIVMLALAAFAAVAHFASKANANHKPAATQEVEALKKARINARVCPGMHADWLDETTVQCVKERP